MVRQHPWDDMTQEQQFLVTQSMAYMDRHYNAGMGLLKDESGAYHSTRASAHYVLGLLLRNAPGDRERAVVAIERVLDTQLIAPGEIYHATFRASPEAASPPAGRMAWGAFPPSIAYSLPETLDSIFDTFLVQAKDLLALNGPEGRTTAKRIFQEAADSVLPPIWRSYDPNWREFIACTFALVLEHFEDALPSETVRRMDSSMEMAVAASIERRRSQSIAMNTNIELMHMFIAHYYGHRFGREDWQRHAEEEAERFLHAYEEFDSFAEYNSATYYGVDLAVLGMWRRYGRTASFRKIGLAVEHGLWRNLALFYNANLENVSGPFSRAYEMEMVAHSSLGVFVYLALGAGYEHMTAVNCESEHDPIIALVGVDVPDDVLPLLREHRQNRFVAKQFRELVEWDLPGSNSNLCTTEAWIGEDLMIGALSGSRNTSGQLHPATVHWRAANGERYSIRLLRRLAGEHWSKHTRGFLYEAHASEGHLNVEIQIETDMEIEVFFEVQGPNLGSADVRGGEWIFPGLRCSLEAEAPAPFVRELGERIEIVYPYRPAQSAQRMSFRLQVERSDD
ncbi:hypothetical protein FHS18_003705 [Paenibacillus phyllosphaerae]|uniref:Uncharacterized protein n=1 Tax=Paenibacillus phyllosphaerae TaxID=274593 RepID=A0A7W5AZH4_9BACL|nr:hypothetical protein [Paenibacillus phyllosphaerae]MBB3111637.1 hypothetical protein [Paenibacillus phyllosphaerae]